MLKFRKFIFLPLLFLSQISFASTVSMSTISADATAGGFNGNFTSLANAINGNIEGSTNGTSVTNIKANSVYEINMASDASSRVYANEVLGIGSDTSSGGVLTQAAIVESGCVPATSASLTSSITACIAYVNGYRVSKSSTSETYTASRDTYVDLSQSGVYTLTAVANGATAPAVAANSIRLAKVVTDGTTVTSVTSLYTTRVAGLIIPANFRDEMIVSKDSTTGLHVTAGSCEVNNAMLTKTTDTTLSISTASDWAGGASLAAASTYGFVGIDTSGNVKLHTTAPTHSNYAVSSTAGKKRYATWSATVYRILGWFYMDGAALLEGVSNLREFGIANTVLSQDTTTTTVGTSYADAGKVFFYNSGGNVMLTGIISGDSSGSNDEIMLHRDGSTDLVGSGLVNFDVNANAPTPIVNPYLATNVPQTTKTYTMRALTKSGTYTLRRKTYIVNEL